MTDRWHLLRNLSEALRRALEPHSTLLRQAATEVQKVAGTGGPMAAALPTATTHEASAREQNRVRRYSLYSQMKSLADTGLTHTEIARQLALSLELGCLFSHIECWRRFVASDKQLAVICEDDIYFADSFRTRLESISLNVAEPYIIKLETFFTEVTIYGRPLERGNGFSIHELLGPHGGSGAYALTRPAVQRLLAASIRMRHAIDIELFFPDRRVLEEVPVLQMIPAPCAQHMMLYSEDTGYLGSQIGEDRADLLDADVFDGWDNPMSSIQRGILFLQGRRRTRVPFG